MFYCEKCRIENEWPQSLMQSRGPCEMCHESALCWDKSSKYLPGSKKFYDANPNAPRDPMKLNEWILAQVT